MKMFCWQKNRIALEAPPLRQPFAGLAAPQLECVAATNLTVWPHKSRFSCAAS